MNSTFFIRPSLAVGLALFAEALVWSRDGNDFRQIFLVDFPDGDGIADGVQ